MPIQIKKTDYDMIVAHAKAGLPNEACGLIAGAVEGDAVLIKKVYPLPNSDESPEHFSMSPQDQLASVKDMRALGLTPMGNFHSHPETPARPSAEDIRLARDPRACYLILSLAGAEPVLKAFHIENGVVTPLTLEVQP